MKKAKKKSDQAIINTWIEDTERYISIGDFELGGNGSVKIFKPTGLAHVFEIQTCDGVFTVTFQRKMS